MSSCLIDIMGIQIKRRGKREYIRGKLVEREGTLMTIRGNLQPERNIKLIRETFGSHIEAAIKVYTTERLRTKREIGGSDVILYNGNEYEVEEIRRYETVLPHYKVIAILEKDER